jgi:serine/threonine-protein kinase RsbW
VALEWGPQDLADTAGLLASELVTNAIQARERSRIRAGLAVVPVVRLWLTSDQISLVIHVWDCSDEIPVRQESDPEDERGRGLMLVDTLSQDRGAYRTAGGKVMWVLISAREGKWS